MHAAPDDFSFDDLSRPHAPQIFFDTELLKLQCAQDHGGPVERFEGDATFFWKKRDEDDDVLFTLDSTVTFVVRDANGRGVGALPPEGGGGLFFVRLPN